MTIFVINLDSATERLRHMGDQLGDNFERLPAVRGVNAPPHLAAQFEGSRLNASERGCYASHLTAYELIVQRDLPYAVVLEDDLDLDADFFNAIQKAVQSIDQWDFIALGGAVRYAYRDVAKIGTNRSLVQYSHLPKSTSAYIISNSGSRKMLQPRIRTRPVDVDFHYGWHLGLRCYGVHPTPTRQNRKFKSQIPKDSKQRFYWRDDPIGYLRGRCAAIVEFGVVDWMLASLSGKRNWRASSGSAIQNMADE